MFTIDIFNNLSPLNIYLSDPSGKLICCLNEYIDENSCSMTVGINQQYELSFTIYKKQKSDLPWYDMLQEGMYLFVEKTGLFKLKQPNISMDGIKDSKEITAYSCDVELEDKSCQLSFNMGTDVSQEYLVKYDDGETERLVNPYTNIPYDWIVLYNTFPEQLNIVLKKYDAGYYGVKEENGDTVVSGSALLDEVNALLSTIPRLKNKITESINEQGQTEYQLTEYVICEYDASSEQPKSITLTASFCDRIQELILFYTKYRDQLSLLSIVLKNTGGAWTVGNIYGIDSDDYTLANKKFQFETDENIYSFLTQTLAQSIRCVVNFNLFKREVQVTPVEQIGNDTGIVISYDTLINSLNITCEEDTLCTRLFVTGADDININQVNFGLSYIDDITYKLNARNSDGNRIYVSDELAEKYMEYIDFRESKRDTYINYSKEYRSYDNKIYEIKYRVPNDSLKMDWGTFSLEELNASLITYKNLLTSLITLYKEDYGTTGLNLDGSVNESFLKSTMYWYDYTAYQFTIKEIECAIVTHPYYNDQSKWTEEQLDQYKDIISAWETDWSLYGSIELQAKVDAYTQNMKLLAEASVIKITPDSDEIKTWEQLTETEKASFGYLEENYYYNTYMELYNNKQSAQVYLNDLLEQISRLENTQSEILQKRQQIINDVTLENYFAEEECQIIYLLYRDSSYNNSNILVTSIDDSDSEIDIMYELLKDGQEQLSILSRPQLTFSLDSDNLLGLSEFQNLWTDFQPGNYMYIQYRDNTYVKLRMVNYSFNPCLPSSNNLSITFSNYLRSKSKVSDVESILGLSSESSSGNSSTSNNSGDRIYGESDDIDVTISNTMLSKLLNSEVFGTRVTNVILDTIDVNALTARLATFGGLVEGTTTIDGRCITTGFIKDKDYNGTYGAINNTKGSIINLETGQFNFGGGKLICDNNTLTVTGHINATSGYIGSENMGFSIEPSCIRNGNIIDVTNTSISGVYIGIDGFNVSGGSPETTAYFTKNSINIGNKLTWDGNIMAIEGKILAAPDSVIGGWTIGSNTIHAQNNSLYTTLKRNGTVAIGLGSPSSTDTTNAKAQFWHDGTVKLGYTPSGYNFTADASGNVTMKGSITADAGTIGGFMISQSKIYAGDESTGVIVMQKPSDSTTWSFAVGGTSHSNYSDCSFRVSHKGALYAKNAILNSVELDGNVTATKLIVKDSILMYVEDGIADINSKCTIMSFKNYDNAVGNQYYELIIGKNEGLIGTNENVGIYYGRTRIPGLLYCSNIDGKIKNTNNDYKVPISSSGTEAYYIDTISSTSTGITVYGNFENKDSNGEYSRISKSFASSTSDQRLKKNIKDTSVNALEQILKIRHREFDWKGDNKHVDLGYIAQELEKINETLVMKPIDDNSYYGINTFYLLSLITKAIQEIYSIINGETK